MTSIISNLRLVSTEMPHLNKIFAPIDTSALVNSSTAHQPPYQHTTIKEILSILSHLIDSPSPIPNSIDHQTFIALCNRFNYLHLTNLLHPHRCQLITRYQNELRVAALSAVFLSSDSSKPLGEEPLIYLLSDAIITETFLDLTTIFNPPTTPYLINHSALKSWLQAVTKHYCEHLSQDLTSFPSYLTQLRSALNGLLHEQYAEPRSLECLIDEFQSASYPSTQFDTILRKQYEQYPLPDHTNPFQCLNSTPLNAGFGYSHIALHTLCAQLMGFPTQPNQSPHLPKIADILYQYLSVLLFSSAPLTSPPQVTSSSVPTTRVPSSTASPRKFNLTQYLPTNCLATTTTPYTFKPTQLWGDVPLFYPLWSGLYDNYRECWSKPKPDSESTTTRTFATQLAALFNYLSTADQNQLNLPAPKVKTTKSTQLLTPSTTIPYILHQLAHNEEASKTLFASQYTTYLTHNSPVPSQVTFPVRLHLFRAQLNNIQAARQLISSVQLDSHLQSPNQSKIVNNSSPTSISPIAFHSSTYSFLSSVIHSQRLTPARSNHILHAYFTLADIVETESNEQLTIQPFGSLSMGLGLDLSDLDCRLIPNPYYIPKSIKSRFHESLTESHAELIMNYKGPVPSLWSKFNIESPLYSTLPILPLLSSHAANYFLSKLQNRGKQYSFSTTRTLLGPQRSVKLLSLQLEQICSNIMDDNNSNNVHSLPQTPTSTTTTTTTTTTTSSSLQSLLLNPILTNSNGLEGSLFSPFPPTTSPSPQNDIIKLAIDTTVKDDFPVAGASLPTDQSPKRTKFTPESSFEVDLVSSVDQPLAKSQFFRTMMSLSEYCYPLIILVKQWAKARAIQDASLDYFNSYGLAILVLFFLQTKGLLPTLHKCVDQNPHITQSLPDSQSSQFQSILAKHPEWNDTRKTINLTCFQPSQDPITKEKPLPAHHSFPNEPLFNQPFVYTNVFSGFDKFIHKAYIFPFDHLKYPIDVTAHMEYASESTRPLTPDLKLVPNPTPLLDLDIVSTFTKHNRSDLFAINHYTPSSLLLNQLDPDSYGELKQGKVFIGSAKIPHFTKFMEIEETKHKSASGRSHSSFQLIDNVTNESRDLSHRFDLYTSEELIDLVALINPTAKSYHTFASKSIPKPFQATMFSTEQVSSLYAHNADRSSVRNDVEEEEEHVAESDADLAKKHVSLKTMNALQRFQIPNFTTVDYNNTQAEDEARADEFFSTLTTLLFEFFYFYGYIFNPDLHVASIRCAHLTWKHEYQYFNDQFDFANPSRLAFYIEDPFNPFDNCARSMSLTERDLVFFEFRRAATILSLSPFSHSIFSTPSTNSIINSNTVIPIHALFTPANAETLAVALQTPDLAKAVLKNELHSPSQLFSQLLQASKPLFSTILHSAAYFVYLSQVYNDAAIQSETKIDESTDPNPSNTNTISLNPTSLLNHILTFSPGIDQLSSKSHPRELTQIYTQITAQIDAQVKLNSFSTAPRVQKGPIFEYAITQSQSVQRHDHDYDQTYTVYNSRTPSVNTNQVSTNTSDASEWLRICCPRSYIHSYAAPFAKPVDSSALTFPQLSRLIDRESFAQFICTDYSCPQDECCKSHDFVTKVYSNIADTFDHLNSIETLTTALSSVRSVEQYLRDSAKLQHANDQVKDNSLLNISLLKRTPIPRHIIESVTNYERRSNQSTINNAHFLFTLKSQTKVHLLELDERPDLITELDQSNHCEQLRRFLSTIVHIISPTYQDIFSLRSLVQLSERIPQQIRTVTIEANRWRTPLVYKTYEIEQAPSCDLANPDLSSNNEPDVSIPPFYTTPLGQLYLEQVYACYYQCSHLFSQLPLLTQPITTTSTIPFSSNTQIPSHQSSSWSVYIASYPGDQAQHKTRADFFISNLDLFPVITTMLHNTLESTFLSYQTRCKELQPPNTHPTPTGLFSGNPPNQLSPIFSWHTATKGSLDPSNDPALKLLVTYMRLLHINIQLHHILYRFVKIAPLQPALSSALIRLFASFSSIASCLEPYQATKFPPINPDIDHMELAKLTKLQQFGVNLATTYFHTTTFNPLPYLSTPQLFQYYVEQNPLFLQQSHAVFSRLSSQNLLPTGSLSLTNMFDAGLALFKPLMSTTSNARLGTEAALCRLDRVSIIENHFSVFAELAQYWTVQLNHSPYVNNAFPRPLPFENQAATDPTSMTSHLTRASKSAQNQFDAVSNLIALWKGVTLAEPSSRQHSTQWSIPQDNFANTPFYSDKVVLMMYARPMILPLLQAWNEQSAQFTANQSGWVTSANKNQPEPIPITLSALQSTICPVSFQNSILKPPLHPHWKQYQHWTKTNHLDYALVSLVKMILLSLPMSKLHHLASLPFSDIEYVVVAYAVDNISLNFAHTICQHFTCASALPWTSILAPCTTLQPTILEVIAQFFNYMKTALHPDSGDHEFKWGDDEIEAPTQDLVSVFASLGSAQGGEGLNQQDTPYLAAIRKHQARLEAQDVPSSAFIPSAIMYNTPNIKPTPATLDDTVLRLLLHLPKDIKPPAHFLARNPLIVHKYFSHFANHFPRPPYNWTKMLRVVVKKHYTSKLPHFVSDSDGYRIDHLDLCGVTSSFTFSTSYQITVEGIGKTKKEAVQMAHFFLISSFFPSIFETISTALGIDPYYLQQLVETQNRPILKTRNSQPASSTHTTNATPKLPARGGNTVPLTQPTTPAQTPTQTAPPNKTTQTAEPEPEPAPDQCDAQGSTQFIPEEPPKVKKKKTVAKKTATKAMTLDDLAGLGL